MRYSRRGSGADGRPREQHRCQRASHNPCPWRSNSMHVTATLKFVLRDLPETTEQHGTVVLTLTNEPRGLPKDLSLASSPLTVTCALKQWKNACTKAEQIRAGGLPALLI